MASLLDSFRRERSYQYGRAWWIRSISKGNEAKKAVSYLQQHQQNLLFVTGSGRSGTQLFSSLLNHTSLAKVFHEPNFREDVATMEGLRRDPARAEKYWKMFRSLEVYKRWLSGPERPFYGEVNGTIRYQIPAIKKLYPQSKVLLMVRDGRGVVRSVMGWPQFYGADSWGAYALAPLPGDPYLDEWREMSRFEKVCWSWREANEFLMKYIPESHWVKLEKITEDYDYFQEYFIKNIGVQIPYETWRSVIGQKSTNATSIYNFPPWEEWAPSEKSAFERICGETMEKLGYQI